MIMLYRLIGKGFNRRIIKHDSVITKLKLQKEKLLIVATKIEILYSPVLPQLLLKSNVSSLPITLLPIDQICYSLAMILTLRIKIPILLLTAFLASSRHPVQPISRSTFFPFSTRRFFRLAFQFEMQKSFKHSRLNPESCCRRLILNSPMLFFAHNVTSPLSFVSLPKLDQLFEKSQISNNEIFNLNLTFNSLF